ncbi:MAG: hypothetical protein KDA47_13840 [Planctomycetales bacterium]|nr:hypothetical protein [Planctomycetales bacterium]
MRRKAVRKETAGVSLFPFLAVLICTMGALIVLLVLVVQQARVQASTVEAPAPEEIAEQQSDEAERLRKLKEARADHEWRREVLTGVREERAAELVNKRNELSYLEQNIRDLEAKWQLLKTQAEELERLSDAKNADQAGLQQRLAAMQAEAERSKRDLDAARETLANRPPAFAIIPYAGPNGTKRRPIYLECTSDAVIFQPEGVRLEAKDFAGPLTPGNPLDAALRATREYWSRLAVAGQDASPYPLLVVRPDGVMAYSKARTAMQGWDDEFGYELVDDDTNLTFPPADPGLAEILNKAIVDARQRQQALIAAMPREYKSRGGLVATSSGGFAPVGGFSRGGGANGFGGDGDASSGFGGRSRGVPGGRGGAGGDTTIGDFDSGPGGTGQSRRGGASDRSTGDGTGTGSGSQSGSGTSGNSANRGGPSANNNGSGNPNQNETRSGKAGSQNGSPGAGGQPGGGSAGSSGAAGGRPGMGGPGGASSSGNGSGNPAALADTRGENWGLPNAAPGLTAVTRPLNVTVLPDRIALMPGPAERWRPIVMPINGPLHDSIDPFVTEVWKQIKNWGIAVPGGYWKPVLTVDVGPGGEARYAELRALLENSGLDVQRKGN